MQIDFSQLFHFCGNIFGSVKQEEEIHLYLGFLKQSKSDSMAIIVNNTINQSST